MPDSRLFRKVALDRLSSPDQIDRLIDITPARQWIALVSVLALLGAGVAWAFVGRVTRKTEGHGVVIRTADEQNPQGVARLLVYVPASEAQSVRPGMRVEISPAGAGREEYGFIRGKVTFVSETPATEAALLRVFENASLVRALAGDAPVTEVDVEMEPDSSTPSGFKWSSSKGAPIRLPGGTPVSAEIVTEETAPVKLVIPHLRKRVGIR
jgi:HlyD family secretion protein